MTAPLRIAILECDDPFPTVKEKLGTYGDIFTELLKAGADAYGHPDIVSSKHGIEYSSFDVVEKQEYPKLEDVDAILLTGSSTQIRQRGTSLDADHSQNSMHMTMTSGY